METCVQPLATPIQSLITNSGLEANTKLLNADAHAGLLPFCSSQTKVSSSCRACRKTQNCINKLAGCLFTPRLVMFAGFCQPGPFPCQRSSSSWSTFGLGLSLRLNFGRNIGSRSAWSCRSSCWPFHD